MELNNPAGRLLNILTEGKKAKLSDNCRKIWSQILNIDESNSLVLIGRIGKVFALVDNIAMELSKIDNTDINRYMSWTKTLENAFSKCDLSQVWGEFIKYINEPVLDYLHMTSGMLSTNRPQPVLPQSDLNTIYDDAKNLIEDIIEADLPTHIKQYYIDQLRKIITSIEEYKITGSYEIVDIVEATFGKAVLSKDYIDDKDNNVGMKKFWKFMARTALIVSTVAGTLQIADYTAKKFPELISPQKVISIPVDKVEPQKV